MLLLPRFLPSCWYIGSQHLSRSFFSYQTNTLLLRMKKEDIKIPKKKMSTKSKESLESSTGQRQGNCTNSRIVEYINDDMMIWYDDIHIFYSYFINSLLMNHLRWNPKKHINSDIDIFWLRKDMEVTRCESFSAQERLSMFFWMAQKWISYHSFEISHDVQQNVGSNS